MKGTVPESTYQKKNVITTEGLDIALIALEKKFNYEIENEGRNISVATMGDLLPFTEVSIGSNIFLVGFPSSLTTDRFYDVDRPLLRGGIVAGKDMTTHTFVIDALAYYGVSGGPVVQMDGERNIKITGIVSRYVPFITEWKNRHETSLLRQDFYNSGYAVCLPLDRVIGWTT